MEVSRSLILMLLLTEIEVHTETICSDIQGVWKKHIVIAAFFWFIFIFLIFVMSSLKTVQILITENC